MKQTSTSLSLVSANTANDAMAEVRYLLLETAIGYALLKLDQADTIALADAQAAINDQPRFAKLAALLAFTPFASAEDALDVRPLIPVRHARHDDGVGDGRPTS